MGVWMFGGLLRVASLCFSAAGFAARVVAAMPGAVVRRSGDVVRQFERVAWGGLPIVAVAGLSVGVVTWMQTKRLLVGDGAEAILPSVLAAAVLGETGPVLAALLVAGRMGAGLGAELGTMVLTEELDAREVLGAPAVPSLVAPRVLACALAVPFLTVVLDAAAVLGGHGGRDDRGGDVGGGVLAKSLLLLKLSVVVPATLKTGAFGLLVGLVGCRTGSDGGGLGRVGRQGGDEGGGRVDGGGLRRGRRAGPGDPGGGGGPGVEGLKFPRTSS